MAAAELAFEILLFEQGAAHEDRSYLPKGMARLGEDAFAFLPSARRIAPADVPAFLAGLSSPAMLATTTTRGVYALLLLDEMAGSRRTGFERGLANQEEVVEQLAKQLELSDGSLVSIEFADRRRVLTLAVVREWARRFVTTVGWALAEPIEGDEADARIVMIRSDGGLSKGGLKPPTGG
jgi:hypothetical protein